MSTLSVLMVDDTADDRRFSAMIHGLVLLKQPVS